MTSDLAAANRLIADMYFTLGRNICAARRTRGHTQVDLARAVGLTRASITNIEAGTQRSPLHVVLAIAQALDVELGELLAAVPTLTDTPLPAVGGPLRSRLKAAQAAIGDLLDVLAEAAE